MNDMNYKKLKAQRFIRYWGKSVQYQILVVLMFIGSFTLSQWLMFATIDFTEVIIGLPAWIVTFGLCVALIYVLVDLKSSIALTISMGSSRREAFQGFQLSRWLYMLEMLALYLISSGAAYFVCKDVNEIHGEEILIYFALMIFMSGFSQMLESIALRIGGHMAIVLRLVMVGCVGGLIGGFGMVFLWDDTKRIMIDGYFYPLIILAVSIVMYFIGVVVNYRFVKKYEVKA